MATVVDNIAFEIRLVFSKKHTAVILRRNKVTLLEFIDPVGGLIRLIFIRLYYFVHEHVSKLMSSILFLIDRLA